MFMQLTNITNWVVLYQAYVPIFLRKLQLIFGAGKFGYKLVGTDWCADHNLMLGSFWGDSRGEYWQLFGDCYEYLTQKSNSRRTQQHEWIW